MFPGAANLIERMGNLYTWRRTPLWSIWLVRYILTTYHDYNILRTSCNRCQVVWNMYRSGYCLGSTGGCVSSIMANVAIISSAASIVLSFIQPSSNSNRNQHPYAFSDVRTYGRRIRRPGYTSLSFTWVHPCRCWTYPDAPIHSHAKGLCIRLRCRQANKVSKIGLCQYLSRPRIHSRDPDSF